MNVLALDTHEVVKELMAAGFTDAQAEAVTRQLRQVQDVDLSTLATKTDLHLGLTAVRAELQVGLAEAKSDLQIGLATVKADLAQAKASLEKSIAETKSDILKWMVGTIGLQTVVIVGAVLTLVRMLH
jgi:hypothetical protein